jgi:acetylornithine deacetylase/succinyl-diaminopimelate desuccinylase-like protein
MLPNAAWRLVWALASLKGPDERIRIPGHYDAALPPSELDRRLSTESPSLEEELRRDYGIDQFLRDATGDALKLSVFEPTCTIQGIATGYQGKGIKTVIPARATAKLDFRLVPDMDPDDVEARLRAHLAASGFADVVITRGGAMWPAKTAADDPLVELTSRTAAEVYGKPSQIVPLSGGSSPAYAFARPLGGIPVVNAGIGYSDSRVHAPDEHVRLSDFLAGARHIARIVDGFADL